LIESRPDLPMQLDANASPGRAGGIGETTGHAIGHTSFLGANFGRFVLGVLFLALVLGVLVPGRCEPWELRVLGVVSPGSCEPWELRALGITRPAEYATYDCLASCKLWLARYFRDYFVRGSKREIYTMVRIYF